MKNYKCFVCGNNITIKDDNNNNITCPHCNNICDISILTRKDKIKTLQHDISIYLLNKEYKKVQLYLDNNYNNLLLEYYRLYNFKMLKKEYDETKFFSFELSYTEEELDTIINHMIEHHYLFTKDNILSVINISNNKDQYVNIYQSINNPNEKGNEIRLRDFLFPNTNIVKKIDINRDKKEGFAYIYISIILYISFFFAILLFSNDVIKYTLTNISFIVPSILLSNGISRVLFKTKNIYLTVLIFIVIYYLITLPNFIIYEDIQTNLIIDHFKGLINSPVDLMLDLLGEMEYEK